MISSPSCPYPDQLRPVSALSGRKEFIKIDYETANIQETQSFPRTRRRPECASSHPIKRALWEITVMSPSSQIEGKRLYRRSAPQVPVKSHCRTCAPEAAVFV